MKILVINAGSSSLKYQLIDMNGEVVLAKGNCERIGIDGRFTHKTHSGYTKKIDVVMHDHTAAFSQVTKALLSGEGKVIDSLTEISAVGHRIVQGGTKYDRSVLVTPEVVKDIDEYAELAPLHNKAHVQGINAATKAFGSDVPQVVVFDTAFHQTMPPKAYMFGIPYEYYEKYAVRRYGFHGTSHRYVSGRCFELLNKPNGEGTRVVSCHLGNGSSIAALKDGKVIDTTMGLTPLDGFIMGTRSGAVDPSVISFIMNKEGLNPKEMDEILNKKSGMLGISGVSSDDRDIVNAIEDGNERAKLAWDMRTYEIIKYIGGYIAALGGVDAIIFTAGIGENQPLLRKEILESLGYRGAKIDNEKNMAVRGTEAEITTPDSTVRAFVIPTNEELVIARDTMEIVSKL
ncbi:MAG: acetate kinase [Oscillospiraceae bacterium]|nr:acetate kinase [Oscillospiraceae bacterium]